MGSKGPAHQDRSPLEQVTPHNLVGTLLYRIAYTAYFFNGKASTVEGHR